MPTSGVLGVKAAIFDMDGLLIDSEPLWQEAEISVFRSVGVPLTRELCRETTGLRLDEVVRYWHERTPWHGEALEDIESQVLGFTHDEAGVWLARRWKLPKTVEVVIEKQNASDNRDAFWQLAILVGLAARWSRQRLAGVEEAWIEPTTVQLLGVGAEHLAGAIERCNHHLDSIAELSRLLCKGPKEP